MGALVSPPVNFSAQQRDGIRARQSNVTLGSLLAFLAVFGRVVVAPSMLAMVFGLTSYLAPGKMFIGHDESYFAFSFMDAVMVGGCTDCQIGCLKTVLQLSSFGNEALMSKPLFENLFTMTDWNYSGLSAEAIALADRIENDGTVCMGGVDEWGSPLTTIKGTPQTIVDVVTVLNLSVVPQALLEVTHAVDTAAKCPTDWVLEAHLRLFKFPTAKASTDFSAVSVADFTIFPERTECRPNTSSSDLVSSRLALATGGTDLLSVVPDILKLFPYAFINTLPSQPRTIQANGVPEGVLQPLLHAYYGGCRVCEVNSTGVYIEDTCTINKHWVNYGLMVQVPDDLPVCSTGDVCVHNYYNSLWEFVTEVDSTVDDRLAMVLNVFRSRYADKVRLSVLPGMVVAQILLMGIVSLYQVMSHKRSVLLTQIWAYRCQNGHMQVLYLAQIMYHLITSSDLYYLGLATGTLTIEALTNLAFCFFAFSYSFVNLLKARSGEQQLARHFRLTWETMQVFITVCTTMGLYTVRQTSLVFILNRNGELLRKTTARGAAMCNLSDSCIVFKHNIVLVTITASLILGAVADVVAYFTQKHAQREGCTAEAGKTRLNPRSIVPSDQAVKLGPPVSCIHPDGKLLSELTSFERHCLGAPFSRLFTDCDDISYIRTSSGVRCSTVEAVLLTGYLFYGEHVYRAQDVVLLLLARLLPRKFTRTFNVLFVRWHLNKRTGRVSYPQSCTWYRASEDAFRLMEARPIA